MIPAMARRGPDDEGLWSDERCALGFRRLAVLDLSEAGHQPMLARDVRSALVFNGEIYNFRDIRSELEALGVEFRSTGDSEVVLESLIQWGAAALSKFNGMFSLAFWDAARGTLLLARDHAGIKPLHYGVTDQGVAFASQTDQLRAHPWFRNNRIDRDTAGLFVRLGFVPSPYGLIEDTHSVEPGQWIQFDVDGRRSHGAHHRFPVESSGELRGAVAVDALEAALSGAVERQLVSDVPVGVFLSGGVDSPLVAALAAARSGKERLRAFTIRSKSQDFDESEDARRYARAIGLAHHVETVDPPDGLAQLREVVAACPEPNADFSMIPTLLVSEVARREVTVVLSGDGGDELFWGYPTRFSIPIEQARYFALSAPGRIAAIAARRWFGRGQATRDVLERDLGSLFFRKHTILSPENLRSCFPSLPGVPDDFLAFQCDAKDPDQAAGWTRWNEFHIHLQRVLQKVDRASMHHSLEVRVPLLDKDVVDVAARIDWRTCLDLDARVGKIPLRSLLNRQLGFSTVAKKGFTVPIGEWLTGGLRPLVVDLLLTRRRELLGLEFDPLAATRMYSELERGNVYNAWGLWLMLAASLWEQRKVS